MKCLLPYPGKSDAELTVYSNVIFADNYWRRNPHWSQLILYGGSPDGHWIEGAFDVPLTGIVTGDGEGCDSGTGDGTAHTQVHTYYHGTIDTSEDCVEGVQIQESWYPNASRDKTGFFFSRLGGGVDERLNQASVRHGISYQHGGYGIVNRAAVSESGPQWANIHSIFLVNPRGQYRIGDDLSFKFRHQDRDSASTVKWYLDRDTNPYNLPAAILGTAQPLPATENNVPTAMANLSTSDAVEGTYHCYAEISSANGGEPRYEYATNILILTAAPIVHDPLTIADVSPGSFDGLPLPQTREITITGTGFLPESRFEFSDGTDTYPNRVPIYDSPTQLRYNIKVGNTSASWTVKVINGSLVSNPKSFTVTAVPDSTSPPAPVSPEAYYAGGVGNDFYYVDWSNPADASGLSKVWWKLGSPPTSPGDGVGLELPLFQPLPVSTLTTNPMTLHLWLEDGAGNKDHNNHSSVLLFPMIGAPFVVSPPQDRSVIEGASAGFSVTVGGAAPFAFQWQKNGVNLPGANLPFYATPLVDTNDSGAQFRVIITNVFGAVTSAWATLTVNTATRITFTGAVSSDWYNPTNWSPQSIPTSSDRLVIKSGMLDVPIGTTIMLMDIDGGQVRGGFTVGGTLNWMKGSLTNAELTVASGGVLNILGGGEKRLSGAVLRNSGLVLWNAREQGNRVEYPGSVYTDTSGGKASSVINEAGGLVDIQYDGSWYNNGNGSLTIANAGVLRKSGGTNSMSFAPNPGAGPFTFNNTGTVEVQSGKLAFGCVYNNPGTSRVVAGTLEIGAGSPGGVFETAAGAMLRVNGRDFGGTAQFIGAGVVRLAGAVSGVLNGVNYDIEGLGGQVTLTGVMKWSNGPITNAELTVASSGVLNILGGGEKRLSGTVLRNSGLVVWNVREQGHLGEYGGSVYTDSTGGMASSVINEQVGLVDIQYDGMWYSSGSGSLTIANAGVVRKSGGTNSMSFDPNSGAGPFTFNNTGTVEVQSGKLAFGCVYNNAGTSRTLAGTLEIGAGSQGGVFDTAAGAMLRVNGRDFGATAQFKGPGVVRLAGAVSGVLNGVNYDIEGLGGQVTLTGVMNWRSGSLTNADLTVASGGVLNILGGGEKRLSGAVLRNSGLVLWNAREQGNRVEYPGSVYTDTSGGKASSVINEAGGLVDIQYDGTWYSDGSGSLTIANAGVLRKSGGTNSMSFAPNPGAGPFTFNNTGTVEVQSGTLSYGASFVQSAGYTRLAGGSLAAASPIVLNGGVLTGTGAVNASVQNAAAVSPGNSPGILNIIGDYTQSPSGVLLMELAGLTPGSGFDKLVVSGHAHLAGSLQLVMLNGFNPGSGDVFRVMSYSSGSGNFASITQPALTSALALTPEYGATAVVLRMVNLIGGPETNTFNLAGPVGPLELRFTEGDTQAYRFQGSSNLVDWVNLSTNAPVNGVFRFVDSAAEHLNRRFYRAVRP
jgi:hypothetical protein